MTRRLILVAQEGEVQLASSFGKERVLFLQSGKDGLSLADTPRSEDLSHAIFVCRRWYIRGAALSSIAAIGSDGGFCRVRNGTRLRVGHHRLIIHLGHDVHVPARWIGRPIVRAIAVSALIGAIVIGFASGRTAPPPSTPSERTMQERGEMASERLSLDAETASLIEEARLHFGQKRTAQARLALFAAMERSPGDARIARLLKEVGRSAEAVSTEDARPVEQLFEEGMRLKRDRDLPGARRAFDEAMEMMRTLSAAPPFAGALAEVRKDVIEELRRRFAGRLSELQGALSDRVAMSAREAVEKLYGARGVIEEIAGAMPGDAEVMRLCREIDAALRTAASRWLAGAYAAEQYSGCAAAGPIYRAIVAALEGSLPALAEEASRGMARCPDGAR